MLRPLESCTAFSSKARLVHDHGAVGCARVVWRHCTRPPKGPSAAQGDGPAWNLEGTAGRFASRPPGDWHGPVILLTKT